MPKGLSTCILMFSLLLVFAISCSGGGTPIVPPLDGSEIPGLRDRPGSRWNGNRVSWGIYLLHVNEDHTVIDVEPLRATNFHINVQPFLEYMFCDDCLEITNISDSGHGTILVDIRLTHPFEAIFTDLTGFDVRGTAIFNAEKLFPNTFMPDGTTQIYASDRVLNADGWTTHFNAEDEGDYEKGKLVAPWLPDPIGNLHPFKAFWTDLNRRMFEASESDTRTFDIDLPPGAFVFGYSVDASWYVPNPNPPVTIPDDFPITANSLEAFQLNPTVVSNTLTRTGGSAVLEIEVFDWQGPATIDTVFVEAPDLSPGIITMTPTGVTTLISATYTVTLNNVLQNAPTTTGVDVLVCATDVDVTVTQLDLRAFNIINLAVADVAPHWRPRGNTFHNIPIGPILPDGIKDFGIAHPQYSSAPGEMRVYFKKDSTQEFWRYDWDYTSAELFAGYPGGTPSWLQPTSRMDVVNETGVMCVLTDSWNQDLQPDYDNYNMTLANFFTAEGLYNWSWFSVADIPGDPNDYQERAIDCSSGWGDKVGDPMYVLYAYESSASSGAAPADVSILSIWEPYHGNLSPKPAKRTRVPRGVGPGLVDENTALAFAIDDTPAGLGPNANLAYILDGDGIEVFEIYIVDIPSTYHGTVLTSMIPIPGIYPVDIECLPAYKNHIWDGSAFAKNNWIAVLLDVTMTNHFVVGILEWDAVTKTPTLLENTIPYAGTPLFIDVDIEAFEIHVWADNAGVIETTVFEYF